MAASDLAAFARNWLLKGGWFMKTSERGGSLGKHVMELVKTVEAQAHSGWYFGRVIQIFNLMMLAYNQDVERRLRSKAPSPGQP